MNLKKIIAQHKREVPHPFSYMGIVEGAGDRTSVVVDHDKGHPMGREDVMVLVATLLRTAWRITNDQLKKAKAQQVNLATYLNQVYAVTLRHTEDGEIKYEDR